MPILQMWNGFRKPIKELALGHTANEWWHCDSGPSRSVFTPHSLPVSDSILTGTQGKQDQTME